MFGIYAVGLLMVIGTGCVGGEVVTAPAASNTAASASGKMKAEIPFSQTGANVLDAKEKYREIRFAGLSGTCADAGLTDNVSYVEDAKLGFFIMKDNEGNFEDDSVSATFTGQVNFDGITFAQDFVHCTVNATFGKDTGEVSCTDANDKAFCTGMYNVTAVPR